ncbi:MAG: HEPN domain-containing protein [Candidatus Omnitrophica bacterium]|nr:HEPN domain-containing protein [Candidatus Omnitrophota bacterium]
MKEAPQKLLIKAQESIKTAEVLLRENQTAFAASRAYYAMFYVAEALLYEKGLTFKKHGGVHSAFGEHFTKPGFLILNSIKRW